MKFGKRYQEYMQRHQDRLGPYIDFKKLKKILKQCILKCPKESRPRFYSDARNSSQEVRDIDNIEPNGVGRACNTCCPVCDRTFFPSLLNDMAAVVRCFNSRAKKLSKLHLATGLRKYIQIWLRRKRAGNQLAMLEEGKSLINYASINALAICKILKKYDKVHNSHQGSEFKARTQAMQMDILQSPWLSELIACRINLMNSVASVSDLHEDCSLTFDGDKPSLSITLIDSMKLDIDLTCSICLEPFFDPISLKCGHIFCFNCACSVASVTIVDGLYTADSNAKCPLCRQENVFGNTMRLLELSVLLSKSCQHYWEKRFKKERIERLQQAKEYWQREHNSLADKLSKQALDGEEGHLIWEEWQNANIQDMGVFYFFD